jgi:hypothetical protein
MSDHWRMAFMFDARGGDLGKLEEGLVRSAKEIRRMAGDADVRIGVVDTHPDLGSRTDTEYEIDKWRTVDGAVEITVAADRAGNLATVARSLREALEALAEPSSAEVMAGPVFPMVTPRAGDTFLSLAFKRFPGTTSEEFRHWWRFQHAGVAIPVMGPRMLAYDQVHVDHPTTGAVARAFGVMPLAYDAYDNLTWANRDDFLTSVNDAEGMARIFADEVGRIDNSFRRNALMRLIS